MNNLDFTTPAEIGSDEWWNVALGSLRVKAWVLRRFRRCRVLPPGCAYCGRVGHAARACSYPPLEQRPFCRECNVFYDGDRCIGDHGEFRSFIRERCMICRSARTNKDGRCSQCDRSLLQQLRDSPNAMTIIEKNVTAAHSREKLGLDDSS